MRNPEKMVTLLETMRAAPGGQTVIAPGRFGLSEDKQEEQQQAALLADAGLAQWTGPGKTILRITFHGHEFIEKLERDRTLRAKFVKLLHDGKPIIEAVATVTSAIGLIP